MQSKEDDKTIGAMRERSKKKKGCFVLLMVVEQRQIKRIERGRGGGDKHGDGE